MSETDWKPIETAPKDGTRVLLYEPGDGVDEVFACMWGTYGQHLEGWVEFDGMDDRQTVDEPTHWMPLPSAPTPSPQ